MNALVAVRRRFAAIVEVLSWVAAVVAVLAGFVVIIGSGGELVLRGGLLVLIGPVAAHICGRTLILLAHADQAFSDLRRALARG